MLHDRVKLIFIGNFIGKKLKMDTNCKSYMSGTVSSDTIIEVNSSCTVEGTSTLNDRQAEEVPLNGCEDENPEKKAKPPPLDVPSEEELQQTMTGPKTPTTVPAVASGQMLDRRKLKERKIGHRRVDEEGQITFKKIQTSQIMGSIQLGISHAVGSLASKPERDLLMQDFTIVETTFFPKDGSNITPAHHYSDFRFKAYAPVAFRYFRDLFGIPQDDFLLSLCNYPLIELTNPGASGSIFYLTDDDEFIIKTVQHKEAEFLQKLLPGYYMNLNQNPRTLLPKFFGLYCYQCGGKNIRLAVMNNLLPSYVRLHEKYDLKGSTYKRKANKQERKKASPTFKDLDFMERHTEGILLEPETYNALIRTMSRDCRVLESFKIMDYSLLVGIHNLDLAKQERLEQHRIEQEEEFSAKMSDESESVSPDQATSGEKNETGLVRSKSMNRQRLAAFSTAMESIQAEFEASDQDEDVPPGGIPAKNSKGENLLLFLGIIDILQSFRFKKKLEHTFKSVLTDGDTVSVHRPGFYAQRFQNFMGKTVFKKMQTSLKYSPSKRKAVAMKKQTAPVDTDSCKPDLHKISTGSDHPQDDDAPPVPSYNNPESKGVNILHADKENLLLEKQRMCANPNQHLNVTILNSSRESIEKVYSVTLDKTENSSLSEVTALSESTADCISESSSCSTSVFSSTLHTVTWTPPHSVGNSTPTHTEGTPSLTESSSSGDAAYQSTPVRSLNKLESLPPIGETQSVGESEVTRL